MSSRLDDVSVIVVGKNEEANIARCLNSLLHAGQGLVKVFAVDDGSSDRTYEYLSQLKDQVTILQTEGVGPAAARNLALSKVQTPLVFFADADCIVDSKCIEILAEKISTSDERSVSIGGLQKPYVEAPECEKRIHQFLHRLGFVSDYLHNQLGLQEVAHNPTCNVLYRTESIREIGGFDEGLWPCEDLDLDLRLAKQGKRMFFTPEAVVEHRRPKSFSGLWKMMKRYGFGHAHIVKKHGPCQKLHALPFLTVLFLLSVFLFPKGTIGVAVFSPLAVFFYWVLSLRSFPSAARYTVWLGGIVFAWLIGFFTGICCPKQIARI